MIRLFGHQHLNETIAQRAGLPIIAALSGAVVGAVAVLLVAVPAMQQSFALQTKQLQSKIALAGDFTSDSSPAEAMVSPAACMQLGGGEVLGAATAVTPGILPAGGMGGGAPQGENNQSINPSQGQQPGNEQFVKKLITGSLINASISNTGPQSTNTINAVNETKVNLVNKNNVEINEQNDQQALTGSAQVSDNTNAGAAVSGNASNSSSSSVSIDINNN